jgi:hypothetical protein
MKNPDFRRLWEQDLCSRGAEDELAYDLGPVFKAAQNYPFVEFLWNNNGVPCHELCAVKVVYEQSGMSMFADRGSVSPDDE